MSFSVRNSRELALEVIWKKIENERCKKAEKCRTTVVHQLFEATREQDKCKSPKKAIQITDSTHIETFLRAHSTEIFMKAALMLPSKL